MLTRLPLLAFSGLVLLACSSGQIPGRVGIPASSVPSPPEDPAAQPRILSARLIHERAPELGGLDGILVVFSQEVDPASLVARMLLVVSKAGHRMPPERAFLSPARLGQTRSVLLVGDFTRDEREPSDVIVIGPLHTAGGTSMRGLSHPVDAPDAPRRVVLAQRLPGDAGRCDGAPQIVRTYWSAPLEDDESIDLDAMRVVLSDGSETSPVGSDPGEDADTPQRGSNVLDLCVGAERSARALRLEEGALPGAASIEVSVEDPLDVR